MDKSNIKFYLYLIWMFQMTWNCLTLDTQRWKVLYAMFFTQGRSERFSDSVIRTQIISSSKLIIWVT